MIRKILQSISNFPLVSGRTDEQFYSDMEAFVVHGANTTVNEQNQLKTEMNNTVDDINGVLDSISNNLNQIATDKVTISQAVANALVAKDAAIAAKNLAEAIYDNFDDRYLGTYEVEPTVDNDGNALRDGALYHRNSKIYVYDLLGAKWVDMMYIPTLLSSLSDIVFGSKANNDVIQYDSATGKWVNRSFYSKAKLDAFIDIHSKTEKISLLDADEFALASSGEGFSLKKISWANIVTKLKSLFNIDNDGNIGTGTQTFNGLGGSGSKNMLINSGFTRWSKSESFSSIANETYSADNWKIGTAGVAPTVYKGGQVFQIGTNSLTINGANGNTTIQVRQYIEDKNCRKLYSGKKVTISCDIYANSSVSADKVISINLDRPAGTNDWSSSYEGIGSSVTIQPNTITRQSVTLTIPSGHYKWGTRLILTINDGLATGQTIAIGNIQMEEGSAASPYEQKTEQREIEENSRYIQKIDSPYSGYTVFCTGGNTTTTLFTGCLELPYPMYSAISGIVNGNFQLEGMGALSSVFVDIHNARDRVLVRGTTGVSTVGRVGILLGNGDSTASFLLTSYLG